MKKSAFAVALLLQVIIEALVVVFALRGLPPFTAILNQWLNFVQPAALLINANTALIAVAVGFIANLLVAMVIGFTASKMPIFVFWFVLYGVLTLAYAFIFSNWLPLYWWKLLIMFLCVSFAALVTARYQKDLFPGLLGLGIGFLGGLLFDERNLFTDVSGWEAPVFVLCVFIILIVAIWTAYAAKYKVVLLYPDERAFVVGVFFGTLYNVLPGGGVFGARVDPMVTSGAVGIAFWTAALAAVGTWWICWASKKALKVEKPKK